jgi:hypothetical protein
MAGPCRDHRVAGCEGPQFLLVLGFNDPEPHEPESSSTGPNTTIWPDSINGCQWAAWRPMISRSSSLMSRAKVGRGA